jgi:aryl-alcohol dehydrogenase-like predicted oxidoreductase
MRRRKRLADPLGAARILPKKSVKHLGENLKAATLQLPPEIIANLNSIGESPKQ